MTPSPEHGSGPEDENILSIARDLQVQIKRPRLAKFGPFVGLAWSSNQPWYLPGFKRTGFRKPATLLLSADLQGRLDVEDWRILLSYYFRFLNTSPRLWLGFLGPFFGVILLAELVAVLTSWGLGLQASRVYSLFLVGGALVALILAFPMTRRTTLRQDKRVAGLIGQRALLDVFKKIDQLQLPRIENAKRRHGWVAWLWPLPNITERIQNLRKE
jgi:hypothetical protein